MVSWRSKACWLLVLPALAAGTIFAVFIFKLSFRLDRSVIAAVGSVAPRLSPNAILRLLHLLELFAASFGWLVFPVVCVGCARSGRYRNSLLWAFLLATMLSAALMCAVDWSAASSWSRYDPFAALSIITGGIFLSRTFERRHMFQLIAASVALLSLALPAGVAMAYADKLPPMAQKVWSTALQQNNWEALNTSSEYNSLRQVIWTGQRVVAVFDAGSAGYQGKVPMDLFRLISLDSATGAKLNEVGFTRTWGEVPLLHVTSGGLIIIDTQPLRILNPDLSAANSTQAQAIAKEITDNSVNPSYSSSCEYTPSTAFESMPYSLSGCELFTIFYSGGKTLAQDTAHGRYGSFASVSQNGRRFALEYRGEEGDPSYVFYELFIIYNTIDGKPIATIRMRHMPARISWAAFSPNGNCFVAGDPDNLSMYRVPGASTC